MATPLPKTLGARAGRDATRDAGPGGLILGLLLAALALLAAAIWSLSVRTIRTTPGLVMIAAGVVTASAFGRPWLGAALAVLGALMYRGQCGRTPYADCVSCGRTPYADCFSCGGTGHHRSRQGGRGRLGRLSGAARRCGLCRGKGVRMRWGRALMNVYRRATYTASGSPDQAATAAAAAAAGPINHADALRRGHPATPVPQISTDPARTRPRLPNTNPDGTPWWTQ